MTETLTSSSYRILGKTFSFNQLLLISICLVSAVTIISFLVGPFYEHSHTFYTGHTDAISHRLFLLVAPILTLLLASALFFTLSRRRVGAAIQPLEAIYKVLLPDEQKIVGILEKEGGMSTQKNLSRRTGLSRLKVHRSVHRLAEKNIVTIESVGRTNMITLTGWLKPDEEAK